MQKNRKTDLGYRQRDDTLEEKTMAQPRSTGAQNHHERIQDFYFGFGLGPVGPSTLWL